MAREVRSPAGQVWEIGVERPALRPRWRGSMRAGADWFEVGGTAMDLAELPALGVIFLLIGVLVIVLSGIGFVLLPLALFVVELIALLVIAAVVVPYRWLRGQHTVAARSEGDEIRWRVGSLSEAREAIASAAASIEAGLPRPQPALGELLD